MEKNDLIKKGILHNKFGCLLLKAGNFEKALDHFSKALEKL